MISTVAAITIVMESSSSSRCMAVTQQRRQQHKEETDEGGGGGGGFGGGGGEGSVDRRHNASVNLTHRRPVVFDKVIKIQIKKKTLFKTLSS